MLLDGGDLWQGSGLANSQQGADMVEAGNLLGIEAMTGHWEFTYGEDALRKNLANFKGEFLAQNVFLTEEAKFNDAKAFDPGSGRAGPPRTLFQTRIVRVSIASHQYDVAPDGRFLINSLPAGSPPLTLLAGCNSLLRDAPK